MKIIQILLVVILAVNLFGIIYKNNTVRVVEITHNQKHYQPGLTDRAALLFDFYHKLYNLKDSQDLKIILTSNDTLLYVDFNSKLERISLKRVVTDNKEDKRYIISNVNR